VAVVFVGEGAVRQRGKICAEVAVEDHAKGIDRRDGRIDRLGVGAGQVVGRFDGSRLTTDGGGLLLRQADRKIGLLRRAAACFTDARSAGRVRAAWEAAGKPIGAYDLLIAGQALRHRVTLVTANANEFARVKGLVWEDWAKR